MWYTLTQIRVGSNAQQRFRQLYTLVAVGQTRDVCHEVMACKFSLELVFQTLIRGMTCKSACGRECLLRVQPGPHTPQEPIMAS